MNSLSVIKLVIKNLLARKGRTLLTILGITIGVAGVIIIISLGAGAQSLILGQVTKLGSNLIVIQPGKTAESGAPIPGLVITSLVNTLSNTNIFPNCFTCTINFRSVIINRQH